MSQENEILKYLQSGKSLTPLLALRLFGTMRLSGRIFDLKHKGYRIEEADVKDGRKRYARYFLSPQLEELIAQNHHTQEEIINFKAVGKQMELNLA